MINSLPFDFNVDKARATIHITREFVAHIDVSHIANPGRLVGNYIATTAKKSGNPGLINSTKYYRQ